MKKQKEIYMNKKQNLSEEYIVFLQFLIDIKDNQINYHIIISILSNNENILIKITNL